MKDESRSISHGVERQRRWWWWWWWRWSVLKIKYSTMIPKHTRLKVNKCELKVYQIADVNNHCCDWLPSSISSQSENDNAFIFVLPFKIKNFTAGTHHPPYTHHQPTNPPSTHHSPNLHPWRSILAETNSPADGLLRPPAGHTCDQSWWRVEVRWQVSTFRPVTHRLSEVQQPASGGLDALPPAGRFQKGLKTLAPVIPSVPAVRHRQQNVLWAKTSNQSLQHFRAEARLASC